MTRILRSRWALGLAALLLAAVAVFGGRAWYDSAHPAKTHVVRVVQTTQQAPRTTVDVLKKLGYRAITPTVPDPISLASGATIFAPCGNTQDCESNYRILATERWPIVYVANGLVVALLSSVFTDSTGASYDDAATIPGDWQNLATRNPADIITLLGIMPTVEKVTPWPQADGSPAVNVQVPPVGAMSVIRFDASMK